jgi:histidinol-phosphate/aromatic aminotransferase/cobyric acid decarboxylase-like protein
MDGYADRSSDFLSGQTVTLRMVGEVGAGCADPIPVESGTCVRVFTGAPLPPGADAVVMQEDTRLSADGLVTVLDPVRPWENVRFRGEDVRSGGMLLEKGSRLGPGQIALLLASGIRRVRIRRPAAVAIAGGVAKVVTLEAPAFRIDEAALRAAITPRTRVLMVNSPHNPSGRILDDAERAIIARVANEFDLIVISDEVYEELWYEVRHRTLVTEPGMRERTIVLGSLGKSFSFTGWKVGWAIAPAPLAAAVRAGHQFATFCAPTPLQVAAAAALAAPDAYFDEFRAEYRARRDRMVQGLRACGLHCEPPQGSYFALADHSAFGFADDYAFCRHLVEHGGVAAIPPGAFYANKHKAKSLVRFAFCKKDATIDGALERLTEYHRRFQTGELRAPGSPHAASV